MLYQALLHKSLSYYYFFMIKLFLEKVVTTTAAGPGLSLRIDSPFSYPSHLVIRPVCVSFLPNELFISCHPKYFLVYPLVGSVESPGPL